MKRCTQGCCMCSCEYTCTSHCVPSCQIQLLVALGLCSGLRFMQREKHRSASPTTQSTSSCPESANKKSVSKGWKAFPPPLIRGMPIPEASTFPSFWHRLSEQPILQTSGSISGSLGIIFSVFHCVCMCVTVVKRHHMNIYILFCPYCLARLDRLKRPAL